MKKVLILVSGLFLVLSLLQCAGSQKPDPQIIVCNGKCDSNFDGCVKKASKNEAKKAACEAAKNKCHSDCEKK